MYSSEPLSGSPAGYSNMPGQLWGDELRLFHLMLGFLPQEDYRAINSKNTQQIRYSSCNRNKHTLLPTWKCPLGINGDVDGGHAVIILVYCILWMYCIHWFGPITVVFQYPFQTSHGLKYGFKY